MRTTPSPAGGSRLARLDVTGEAERVVEVIRHGREREGEAALASLEKAGAHPACPRAAEGRLEEAVPVGTQRRHAPPAGAGALLDGDRAGQAGRCAAPDVEPVAAREGDDREAEALEVGLRPPVLVVQPGLVVARAERLVVEREPGEEADPV